MLQIAHGFAINKRLRAISFVNEASIPTRLMDDAAKSIPAGTGAH
jgi:hypothetical protein